MKTRILKICLLFWMEIGIATNDSRMKEIRSVLTGSSDLFKQKREKSLGYIRQFQLPHERKPEKFLHDLIVNLNIEDNQEYKELISVAQEIVVASESHKYINDIIERMNLDRPVGLSKIVDLAAKHQEWSNFTAEIRNWLKSKKGELVETPSVVV